MSGERVTGVVRVLVGLASLGAHVVQRSHTAGSHVLQVGLTHTKVGYLNEAVAVDKHVGGLDVPARMK
jgi:hypothetical protein